MRLNNVTFLTKVTLFNCHKTVEGVRKWLNLHN